MTDYLTDYDSDFRNIVYSEIAKRKPSDFNGSKGKKSLLDDIKEQFNSYLLKKDLDQIIFGVHYKVFAITERWLLNKLIVIYRIVFIYFVSNFWQWVF